MFLNKHGFDITGCRLCLLSAFLSLVLLISICELLQLFFFFFTNLERTVRVLIFSVILIQSLFVLSHQAHQTRGHNEIKFQVLLPASSGVPVLMGVTHIRRRVVSVVLPRRGSEPCRSGDRVRGRGVT